MTELERLVNKQASLNSVIKVYTGKNSNIIKALEFYDESLLTEDVNRQKELASLIEAYLGGDINGYLALRAYKDMLEAQTQIGKLENEGKSCIK